MTGGSSRFTSDRRTRGDASWAGSEDWEAGTTENVDIVESGLVPQTSSQGGDILDHVTDGFESGNLSEYTVDSNWGNGGASVVQSPVAFDGDRLAEVVTNGRVFALGSVSGLPSYPGVGDAPIYHVFFPNGDDNALYLYYGVQSEDAPNSAAYRVTIRNVDNSMRLDNRNSGDAVASGSTQYIPSNEWIQVVISWGEDGTHSVRLFDANGAELGFMSGTDGELTSGGIGYGLNNRNGNRSKAYVDFVGYNSPR